MKRTNFALITILTLIFAMVTSLQVVNLVSANFYPTPSLFIQGPHNSSYPNGSNFTFTVEVHISMDAPAVVSIIYSLDDGANITFTNLGYTTWSPISANLPNNHKIFSIQEHLDNLSDGNHTLRVYSHDATGNQMSESREFTVNTHNENSTPSPTLVLTAAPTGGIPQQTIAIAAVLAAIIAIGSLVYFKKRKRAVKVKR